MNDSPAANLTFKIFPTPPPEDVMDGELPQSVDGELPVANVTLVPSSLYPLK